jgi:hypothetical protein
VPIEADASSADRPTATTGGANRVPELAPERLGLVTRFLLLRSDKSDNDEAPATPSLGGVVASNLSLVRGMCGAGGAWRKAASKAKLWIQGWRWRSEKVGRMEASLVRHASMKDRALGERCFVKAGSLHRIARCASSLLSCTLAVPLSLADVSANVDVSKTCLKWKSCSEGSETSKVISSIQEAEDSASTRFGFHIV